MSTVYKYQGSQYSASHNVVVPYDEGETFKSSCLGVLDLWGAVASKYNP